MTQYLIKLFASAAIIAAVSEIAKRNTILGGILASLPMVSLLSMIWLYRETGDAARVGALSVSIFWLVLPSLVFFVALPLLLKARWNFYSSLGLSVAIMLMAYGLMLLVLKQFKVRI